MAGPLILEARRAILPALKANAPLIALLPPTSVYPGKQPADAPWPFVRWGGPTSLPIDAACVAGATITFFMHSFAKPRYLDGAMIETAEDFCSRIDSAVVSAIRGGRILVEGGLSAKITWRGTNSMEDGGEPDAWHAASTFDARILAA